MDLDYGAIHMDKLLIVDDEAINREFLAQMLKSDYEIDFAADGKEALALSAKNAYSLILLDLIMPVMDGFAFLRKHQEDENLRLIPVIVLTAATGMEVESLRMGAIDFIKKPFDAPEVIRARVWRALRR